MRIKPKEIIFVCTPMNFEQRIEQAIVDLKQADEDIINLLHSHKELLWKPTPDRWSAAQCVEHIVVSNGRYFPVFDQKLSVQSNKHNNQKPYKPTFWGKMIYNAVDPDQMERRKSKTQKIFKPQPTVEIPTLIRRFEQSQEQLLGYMHRVLDADATQKISSPISKIIRYSLADTLAILSKHEIRHHRQALNVLKLRG